MSDERTPDEDDLWFTAVCLLAGPIAVAVVLFGIAFLGWRVS